MTENYDQSKNHAKELVSAYNSHLQLPSFLTDVYRKLLKYSNGHGTNYHNITRESDCLTFDYLQHKFKIFISITFKNDEHYKRIVLSEIGKKIGEEKLLKQIYLDRENCIVNFLNDSRDGLITDKDK